MVKFRLPQVGSLSDEAALYICSVGLITVMAFETLATTTAMPTVVAALGSDGWYSLAAGVSLTGQVAATVAGGWWCDGRGPTRPFITGVLTFAVGALVAGIAPNLMVFVIGRTAQGVGTGLSIVSVYVLLGALVAPPRRPQFIAAFSYAWVVPAMVGPAVAGTIVHFWHWRPIFWLITPITLIVFIPALPLLVRVRPLDGAVLKPTRSLLWAFATAVGIGVWQVAGGWSNAGRWILAGLALLVLLVALPRVSPPGTFRLDAGLPAIVLMRLSAMAAMIGVELFVPLILSRVHQWDPRTIGVALAIGTITWTLGSWIQTRVRDLVRRWALVRLGTRLVFFGSLGAALLPLPTVPAAVGLAGWSVLGLGMGLVVATSSDLMLAISERVDHGKVSASVQLADAIGPALVMGLSAIVLHTDSTSQANYGAATIVTVAAALVALVAGTRLEPR